MNITRLSAVRERYMQDGLPIRLGGLAANLMRIASVAVASVADHPANRQIVDSLLEESKFFIEWTAPHASLDEQEALVELQIRLALWQLRWYPDSNDPVKRARLAQEARSWATEVLEMSGLLIETGRNAE
jgi:hypothetical protein